MSLKEQIRILTVLTINLKFNVNFNNRYVINIKINSLFS